MVRAWYMDCSEDDQRLEHHRTPPQFIDIETLKNKTGVLYWQLDADNYEIDGKLEKIRKNRGYTYSDHLTCSKDKLPNYDEKLKSFYAEHIHADEEIRFILEGSGYFDVRDNNDEWIRIEVTKGDLIVLPAGIYHRFTLDVSNFIRVMRLFVGEPIWTPINRPAEDHPARVSYIKMLTS